MSQTPSWKLYSPGEPGKGAAAASPRAPPRIRLAEGACGPLPESQAPCGPPRGEASVGPSCERRGRGGGGGRACGRSLPEPGCAAPAASVPALGIALCPCTLGRPGPRKLRRRPGVAVVRLRFLGSAVPRKHPSPGSPCSRFSASQLPCADPARRLGPPAGGRATEVRSPAPPLLPGARMTLHLPKPASALEEGSPECSLRSETVSSS